MTDRDIHLQKYWFQTGTSNGHPLEGQVLRDDWDDVFLTLESHKGDFKTPNGHWYRKMLRQRYVGTWTYYVPAFPPTNPPLYDLRGHGTNPYNAAVDVYPEYATFNPAVYNMALSKFYDKVRGQIDLSIDLYQYRQSVALARKITAAVAFVKKHPVDALRKSYDWFTKNQGRRTRYLKGPGQLWLEYTYGLKPTLQTIYDTIIELNRNFEPLRKVEVQDRQVKHDVYVWHNVHPQFGVETVKFDTSTRVKISCKYRASANAANLLGQFTSLNPVSFVWENIPFSFVADWFLDVGGYMRNIESAFLFENVFVSGYVTETHMSTFNGVYHRAYHGGDGSTELWDLSGWSKYSEKRRTKLTGAPFPRPPMFKADLSSGRLLNAAALLTNFLGK